MRPSFLLLTFFVFLSLASFAQKSKKTKNLKPFTDEVCKCIETIDYASGTHDSQAQMCITTTLLGNFTEIMEFYGIKTEELNEKTGYDIGVKFGQLLMEECPAFMTYALKSAEMQTTEETLEDWDFDDETLTEWEYTDPIEATVSYVDRQGLLTFVVLDSEGFEHRLTVLTDFQGSEALLKSDPKGKKFNFYYENWEIYNPLTDTFEPCAVIIAIE